jgi:glycosyltransferase involved in cell wall biosynthesis
VLDQLRDPIVMLMSGWTVCAAAAGVSLVAWVPVMGLLILLISLQRVFRSAPLLSSDPPAQPSDQALTVVIPAYNEQDNIVRCLSSVLASDPPALNWSVVVVDDQSTDRTAELAREIVAARDNRAITCRIMESGERPMDERWVGKNWACSQAMDVVETPWVLFLDADVVLSRDALKRALASAVAEGADLFSLAPRLVCDCLAEWMVQPIMASLLGLGFPISEANDPASPVAFAAGPFMLFRHSAYTAIGGHRALAGEVVEDLALARTIKQTGHRLIYRLGLDAVDLQMYSDLSSLWEGWTKNWYLGLERSVLKSLLAGAAVFTMFSLPWLLLMTAPFGFVVLPDCRLATLSVVIAAATAVLLQWMLRLWTRWRFGLPLNFWWLMGLGGLIVAAIAPTSVWRSLTGRGWTWKGRPLA